MKRILILCCFLSSLFCSTSFALEKTTHEKLNEAIAPVINQSLVNIGFSNGVEEFVNGKKIKIWIKDGGRKEDEPFYSRSLNHFLNPLTNSGYLGKFKSASQWAQEQGTFGSLFGGDYSWKAVRQYYYLGLTSATKTDREKNLADTFQGIGQLMHLVEDMSVPAHTRNDFHLFYNYEKFVQGKESQYTLNPIYYGGTIYGISSFFDTDQYNGTNPSSSNTVGLSEYTQANFFSEETINASSFPYPKIFENTPIVKKDFTNTLFNTTYPRQYFLKNCCGETKGGQGYLLAAVDYLDYYRLQYPSLSFALPKIPVLDDNVYNDYASLLLPRAVGYSAGLLNYFFRGQIDMIKDPNNSSQYVIKNESDEYMTGTFSLYYDDTNDNRRFITSWGRGINPNSPSDPVAFTEPTDAKEKGKYILVFQGTLGSETGAVVGSIIKTKQAPLVFVIQERLVLNSQPEETVNRYFTPRGYDWLGYVYVDQITKINKWKVSNQYAEGKFAAYTPIKEIRIEYPPHALKSLSEYGITNPPLPKLYINGQIISNGVWKAGDASSPPMTWKIEDAPLSYLPSRLDWISPMKVTLSDGTVFEQGILNYEVADQGEYKRLYGHYVKKPDGTEEIKPDYISHVRYSRLVLNGYYSRFPGAGNTRSYKLIELSGSPEKYDSQTWTDPDGSTHNVWERVGKWGEIRLDYTHVDQWLLTSKSWNTALSMFDSLPGYLPLTISGRVDRIYSESELKYLQSVGMEPVNYSIKIE